MCSSVWACASPDDKALLCACEAPLNWTLRWLVQLHKYEMQRAEWYRRLAAANKWANTQNMYNVRAWNLVRASCCIAGNFDRSLCCDTRSKRFDDRCCPLLLLCWCWCCCYCCCCFWCHCSNCIAVVAVVIAVLVLELLMLSCRRTCSAAHDNKGAETIVHSVLQLRENFRAI